ncbi:MAG: hypothetical protein IPK60_01385 [Sandaracinaceae bacterium]|nr:hypothetical protein [Sandaracinaceae bacterium]
MNGTIIATSVGDLLDGVLVAPITLTGSGAPVTDTNVVWTGTYENGSSTANVDGTCLDWSTSAAAPTGGTGDLSSSNGAWTFSSGTSCATLGHLYCFESGT